MKKTKATDKDKEAIKKPAKKTSSPRSKKPVDLAEVRKDITNMVATEGLGMAVAVAAEALRGELAPMKYLFEVSGLYPAAPGTESKSAETSLAHTLLRRLGLPTEPVVPPEDDLQITTDLGKMPGRRAKDSAESIPGEGNPSGGRELPRKRSCCYWRERWGCGEALIVASLCNR
jgi:hypothetical protein